MNPNKESQSLLRQPRFKSFFWTQTLGAFNDNVFKNALVILITFGVAGLSDSDINLYVNLAAGLFILPFFLFSATSGQIAEKYEKSMLIRRIKLLEIAIMGLAVIAFWFKSVPMLMSILFLMGTQSTLFGPVKYSILPQHLPESELIAGNAWVEAATFLAILLGTMLGGWLIAQQSGAHWVSVCVVVIAILGWWMSRGIPRADASAPGLKINWNPLTETWRNFKFMRTNQTVFLSVLGISWFWFYGAVFLSQLPNLTKLNLSGNAEVVTLLLTVFSLGIGLGSLLCEKLSGKQVEIGLVPLGSIGLTLFGIDLFFALPENGSSVAGGAAEFIRNGANLRVMTDLLLIGVFGGFYIVPLYALIQLRSHPEHRSRIIAGNNILNALFMVVAAIMSIVLLNAGLSIPQLLLVVALMNAAVAVFIYSLLPEFLMRFMVWMLINTLYRIRVNGQQHIPEEGAALVVCNHVSFVDALIVGGSIRRPIRFVMYYKIFQIPVLNFIFRTAKAIPIAGSKENPELMQKAFDEIARALENGEVVGIFPEGGLTPDGSLQTFRPGVEKILQRTPVPVVPMALRNLWKSMWSRRHLRVGRARLPRRIRADIELLIDQPIATEKADALTLHNKVKELRGDMR